MGQPCRGIPAGLPFLLAFGWKSIFVFVSLNVYFAALMAATKGSPWMGPSFTPMDQDPRGPWSRCQKNVVSSLREMPANAVWPANVFLAIACDSVTQA